MSGPGPGQGPDQQQPPQGGWGQVPPPQQGWGQAPPPPPQGYGQVPPPPQQSWGQAPPPPPGYQQPTGGFTPPPSWSPPPIAPGPAAGIQYADFVPRLVAYIIDSIILFIPNAILSAILIGGAYSCAANLNTFSVNCGYNWGGFIIVAVLEAAISAAYFVYTWSTMRASPGQRILGMMVLNEADGSPISYNTGIMRWAILALPGSLVGVAGYGVGSVGLLGLLALAALAWELYLAYTSATDTKRQGFHDKFVHTVVVRAAIR